MIEEIIDFVKKNKLLVICLVIIAITYCNKKNSLENFSSEYPNFIDISPCDEEENKDMEHCKRGPPCESDEDCGNRTIVKDGNTININYCTPSKSTCNLMNNENITNNYFGKTCAECINDNDCDLGKVCFAGYCKEMEIEDNGLLVKEGAPCNNTNQCGLDKHCKTSFKDLCVGTCQNSLSNNLTCEKDTDCEYNDNGKFTCSKKNTCISETEYNFYDMKEKYEELYNILKDSQNFTNIKDCLEKIISENNEADNSDVGAILMYKQLYKYESKLGSVYEYMFSTEGDINKNDLIVKIEELICSA